MIDPRNGNMVLRKPKIAKMTSGGIRRNEKMLNQELWKLDRVFEVLAVDPTSGIGILAGDKIYLNPDNIGQVVELKVDGELVLVLSCFAVLGIASKVPRGATKLKIDPDLVDAQPMVTDNKGRTTIIMGREGKS